MWDKLMRKAIPTGELQSREPWDLWMWRRPSSPTPLYHCNHQPEAKITMQFKIQIEKGEKAQLKHKKTRVRTNRERNQEALTIWFDVLDLAGKGEELTHLPLSRQIWDVLHPHLHSEEEIAIDIRIALLCHRSSWSRLLQKARISSLQNMVEATFRSKYVRFFCGAEGDFSLSTYMDLGLRNPPYSFWMTWGRSKW